MRRGALPWLLTFFVVYIVSSALLRQSPPPAPITVPGVPEAADVAVVHRVATDVPVSTVDAVRGDARSPPTQDSVAGKPSPQSEVEAQSCAAPRQVLSQASNFSCFHEGSNACGVLLAAFVVPGEHERQLVRVKRQVAAVRRVAFGSDFRVAVVTNAVAAAKVTLRDLPRVDIVAAPQLRSALPFDVLPLSPFGRTLYLNASVALSSSSYMPSAVLLLPLLEHFDALMPPYPGWDGPLHGPPREMLLHPALILARRGPGLADLLRHRREQHGAAPCPVSDAEVCSLDAAARRSWCRLRPIAPYHCADDRHGEDLCTMTRPKKSTEGGSEQSLLSRCDVLSSDSFL
jgi:hypothetical protein